ncbi:hypothetical protein AVEN_139319-1 [Araneus ventricosus]|uniref:Uncharacterized protein n=1 Tax=Araneus ventricosus TaxID=182803 RepID=A0A4Y2GSW0_ARAVE|nr:hypothetical protein AVEN_139319-1 [Araneus ventricosus]
MTVTKTAAGVLTAITGHGPSPPEEGGFSSTYSWSPPSGTDKRVDQKEHHPALPKHSGSTMRDRPPRQHSRALWPPHNNPITSCDDPRFTGVLPPVFGDGPPPLLYPQGKRVPAYRGSIILLETW